MRSSVHTHHRLLVIAINAPESFAYVSLPREEDAAYLKSLQAQRAELTAQLEALAVSPDPDDDALPATPTSATNSESGGTEPEDICMRSEPPGSPGRGSEHAGEDPAVRCSHTLVTAGACGAEQPGPRDQRTAFHASFGFQCSPAHVNATAASPIGDLDDAIDAASSENGPSGDGSLNIGATCAEGEIPSNFHGNRRMGSCCGTSPDLCSNGRDCLDLLPSACDSYEDSWYTADDTDVAATGIGATESTPHAEDRTASVTHTSIVSGDGDNYSAVHVGLASRLALDSGANEQQVETRMPLSTLSKTPPASNGEDRTAEVDACETQQQHLDVLDVSQRIARLSLGAATVTSLTDGGCDQVANARHVIYIEDDDDSGSDFKEIEEDHGGSSHKRSASTDVDGVNLYGNCCGTNDACDARVVDADGSGDDSSAVDAKRQVHPTGRGSPSAPTVATGTADPKQAHAMTATSVETRHEVHQNTCPNAATSIVASNRYCDVCDQTFKSRAGLTRHLGSQKHNNNVISQQCTATGELSHDCETTE